MTAENLLFYLLGGLTGFILSEILQYWYTQKQEEVIDTIEGEFK